ncbi:hypothetical protein E2C01_010871 [Portunus trituberculatus]|uniref:Uncharacterized protein n=1 Tax=Portunus trituberculatus TaxID=210409 RepID=A0A5B7D9K6_PORTR|nr:hypothetical protein [Portunus trituberculatus]
MLAHAGPSGKAMLVAHAQSTMDGRLRATCMKCPRNCSDIGILSTVDSILTLFVQVNHHSAISNMPSLNSSTGKGFEEDYRHGCTLYVQYCCTRFKFQGHNGATLIKSGPFLKDTSLLNYANHLTHIITGSSSKHRGYAAGNNISRKCK